MWLRKCWNNFRFLMGCRFCNWGLPLGCHLLFIGVLPVLTFLVVVLQTHTEALKNKQTLTWPEFWCNVQMHAYEKVVEFGTFLIVFLGIIGLWFAFCYFTEKPLERLLNKYYSEKKEPCAPKQEKS